MFLNIFYALIATLGFAVMFNIKEKNLLLVSIGGGLGWFFYLISSNLGLSNTLSMFIAAIAIGIYSEFMARIRKTPVTTFVICALIPLVPGNGMYYTMYEWVKGNAENSLNNALNTLSGAGAIAVGIVLVSTATKLITYKKRG